MEMKQDIFTIETIEELKKKCDEYRINPPYIMHINKQLAEKSWNAISKYYNIKESYKEFIEMTEHKKDNGFMWIFEDRIEMKL